MNFRLCFVLLLELFMFTDQCYAQDAEEYYSYNEGLPSPILKKAINNLVMCMIHPKNCPGAYKKRNSDVSEVRQEPVVASMATSDSNQDGSVWSLSGLLDALHRLQQNRFYYNDDGDI